MTAAFHCGFKVNAVACGSQLRQFNAYYALLLDHLEKAKLFPPPYLNENTLEAATEKLLQRNRFYKRTLVEIYAVLRYENTALDTQIPTTTIALCSKREEEWIYPTRKAEVIGIYTKSRRDIHGWQGIQWLSDPLVWHAQNYAKRIGINHDLLLNNEGRIADSTAGAPYFQMDKNTIVTPPLEEGATEDPIHKNIAWLAQSLGFRVEQDSITPQDMQRVQGALLASTRHGIIPLVGIGSHRFHPSLGKKILPHLNRYYFPDQKIE